MTINALVIESGIIKNIVVVEAEEFAVSQGWVIPEPDQTYSIGWSYQDGVFTPPPSTPEPIPESVTRRQILTGLAVVGWITEAEALAALTVGATPAAVDAVINGLPAEHQFAARMKWAGFRDALRDDEMVAALATIEGKTGQEIDDFFRVCAAIE